MTKKATKAAPQKPAAKKAPTKKVAEATPAPQTSSEGSAGGKVGKTQLAELVAEKSGLSRKEAGQAVEAVMEAVIDAIKDGKSVGLPGLGTFNLRDTAARTGVRPGTSEKIEIPAGKKVGFKVASTLKGALGGADAAQ